MQRPAALRIIDSAACTNVEDMSKHTVILVRHAKAEHNAHKGDRERALTERGRNQSAELARQISPLLQEVGAVLVSPAVRARQTWEHMADASGEAFPNPKVMDDIYGGDPEDIVEAVRMAGEGKVTVVVGHEPTISEAAQLIAEDPDALPWGVPTATAIIMSSSKDWKEWHRGVGENPQIVTAR